MAAPLLEPSGIVELEGTAEEIQQRLADFAGQRLHVTIQMLTGLPAQAQHPLDAALQAIWEQVPDASWQQFPADFGDNLDHYLHGTPKRK